MFPDLPTAYNVKEAGFIHTFRKINIIFGNQKNFSNLVDIPPAPLINHEHEQEAAVSLAALVREHLDNPTACSYHLISLNGERSASLTWDELCAGYWLQESEKSIFTDPALQREEYQVQFLKTIEAIQ